jgi:hypothetical protein
LATHPTCATESLNSVAHQDQCATECLISVAHVVLCATEIVKPMIGAGPTKFLWRMDCWYAKKIKLFLWRTVPRAPQNKFLWRSFGWCATELRSHL